MFKKLAPVIIKLKIVYIIFFSFTLFILSLINITQIYSKTYYMAGIVYSVLLVGASIIMLKIKNNKLFLAGLVLLSFSLRLVWILFANTEPVSDFSILNQAANIILDGNFSKLKEIGYFNMWVYQLGFSVYSALLYFLFGSNIFIVKLFNVLFSTGSVMLVYFIAQKTFNIKCARISSLLYCIYIQSIIFNSMLTNQVVSLFFIYLGILIILCKPSLVGYLLSGLSIAVGHILRPEGSFALYIIAFATLAYSLFNYINNAKSLKDAKILPLLSKIAVFILCFNLGVQLFGYSLKSIGITDHEYKNRNTYWKFVLGLNSESNGAYSNEDAKILDQYPIGDSLYEKELEIIKERLQDKKQLVKLICKKFIIMWSSPDYSIHFITPGTTLSPNQSNYIIRLEKVQYTVVMLLSFLSILFILGHKNKYNLSLYIFILLICGTWFVYLLIEIQPRYRYFIMPSFFILSGFGLYQVIELLKLKSTREKS